MNLSFFIAKRLAFTGKKSFSLFITRIAIAAVALSVSVMVLGTAITQGYQKDIKDKFIAAWGDVHITQFLPDPNGLMNDDKFVRSDSLLDAIRKTPGVAHVFTYSLQSAILKSPQEMEGIILKGIEDTSNLHYFKSFLKSGNLNLPRDSSGYCRNIALSQSLANKLNVKQEDALLLYMVDRDNFQPRARKVKVTAIFSTGVEDFDQHVILGDQRMIQQFHHEPHHMIQGYEVHLNKIVDVKKTCAALDNLLTAPITLYPIEKRFASIFSWLGMMKTNERIIIIIMMIIAFINMITALLILILERTRMIGVLKTVGMQPSAIRTIFLYNSAFIIVSGVLIGMFVGLGLAYLQYHFHFVPLDESSYFISYVPIYIRPDIIFGIGIGTIFLSLVLMLIPTILVHRLNPSKAVRFQ